MNEAKKETRGRKLIGESARIRRNVVIDDDDWAQLANIGNGNKSEGIHALIEFFKLSQLINLMPTSELTLEEFSAKSDVFIKALDKHFNAI